MSGDVTHEDAAPGTPEAAPTTHQDENAVAREDSVLALAEPASEPPVELTTQHHADTPEQHTPEPEPEAAEEPANVIPAQELHDQPAIVSKPARSPADHEATDVTAPDEEFREPATIATADDATEVTASVPAPADLEDEPTTIVLADGGVDDEVTTFLPTQAEHEPDEATTFVLADPHADEDEATTLLTTPAYDDDEATTLVQAVPDDMDDEPTSIMPVPALPQAGPATSAPAPQTRPAGTHDPDESVTEIRPAALAGGQAQGAPDWFIENLQHFTQALRVDASGATRPPQEVQQLALAARDMIARVAMQGGTRTAADGWTGDTVLQPDQLLANTYIVRSLIARGGIGEIYRTRHRDLKTEHAVKVLLPRYALDPTVLSLMQDEARLLACVRHEAVVRCQDLLRDADGRPMLVMDFLRGRTLSARLREGRLATPDLIVLARRLAEGLTAIHAAGIIHQDISPDNVILADDSCGAATIIDFGLARRVGTGRDMHRNLDFAGKYSWSSPEQLSGRPMAVDARSDLYSLGLMLAAAARGYRLDMGQDLETARAARTTVPSLAGIEEPLAGLIEALLAPSPGARLGSATDIEPMLEPKPRSFWARIAPYFGLSASF